MEANTKSINKTKEYDFRNTQQIITDGAKQKSLFKKLKPNANETWTTNTNYKHYTRKTTGWNPPETCQPKGNQPTLIVLIPDNSGYPDYRKLFLKPGGKRIRA